MKVRHIVCLVLSFFVVGLSGPLAMSRPLQSRMLLNVPEGEIIAKYVGKVVNSEVLGYFTYVAGYDGPYFSDEMIHDETTAYFTVRTVDGGARPSGVFTQGNLASYESEPGGGGSIIYFDGTPDGDYTQPDTFSDGTMLSYIQYQTGSLVLKLQPPDPYTLGIGFRTQIQTFAGSFMFGGNTYTWGQVGGRIASFYTTAPNPTDPTVIDFIGHTTRLPSAE